MTSFSASYPDQVPRHYNRDKDAAEKLLIKVLFGMPVIENENATMFIVLHGLHHSRKIEFELLATLYYKSQCQQKAQGLQAVGPEDQVK